MKNPCISCRERESLNHDIFCEECKNIQQEEYSKEASIMYWAERDEMAAGIHPSQQPDFSMREY